MKAPCCAIISACLARFLRHSDRVSAGRSLLRRSLLAASIAVPAIARAQVNLPDRALRIVVGFAAGGGSDAMARLVAAALERRVGRRVTVENRPGGTGTAAGEALKIGAADGSVVAFMPTPSLVAKLFMPSYPFDPVADLAPITTAGTFLDAFAVSPTLGVSTVAEYVQWLKDDALGRNKLGTTATDALLKYYAGLFSREFGVKMEGQAFRGTSSLVADMADGKVPAGVAGLTSFLVAHRGGRVRDLRLQARRSGARLADGSRGRLPRPDDGGVVRLLRCGRHAAAAGRCLEPRTRGGAGDGRGPRAAHPVRPRGRDLDAGRLQ